MGDAYERARGTGAVGTEGILGNLWARGCVAHPTFPLGDEAFAAHLGRCVADLTKELHAADLFIVAAALAGLEGAVEHLRETYRPALAKQARMGQPRAFLEEVEERLWDALLVGGDAGPRLALYSGAIPLERWLGVSAQRIALTMLRHVTS